MNRCNGIRCTVLLWVILLGTSCSRKQKPVFEGSSVLEATEILVGAKTAGTVVALEVQEGDSVAEGQVLAKIDAEKIELQKRQLAAGLSELRFNIRNAERAVELARETFEAAEKKFGRIRALHGEASVSQQQYEDAETGFKAAQTQFENAATSLEALRAKETQVEIQQELAESQIRDATVTAPISGTAVQVYIDRGEIARPGGPVVSLAYLTLMWIKVYVKESGLGRIRLNDRAALTVGSWPDRVFTGRISWISPKAEFTPKMVQTKDARSDLVYAVKIELPNPDGVLKIGMPADVRIESPDQAATER